MIESLLHKKETDCSAKVDLVRSLFDEQHDFIRSQ